MVEPMVVTVVAVKGSAPREVGATMQIWPDHQTGTIGGGALEWEASKTAREMITAGQTAARHSMPLGPQLGQCCGGAVTLQFQRGANGHQPEGRNLWIWGAGHVGRAIAAVIAPLQGFEVTLIDTTQDRLPDALNSAITPLVATDPTRLVAHAPQDAHHLILTYAHDIDFALCDMLLTHGFGEIGLIGSTTKWARFQKRLIAIGHDAAQVRQIVCPIGNPALGKAPQAIAISVAHTLLSTGCFDAKGTA